MKSKNNSLDGRPLPFTAADWRNLMRCCWRLSPVLLAVLLISGCASPSVRQQRLVAKPNMVFSDSTVFNYNSSRLLSQIATGYASTSGSQNSGCTSCR